MSNCLHLQLYRDSKDRYKQGQTKASLSLQHFLGVQTGFTLDKESNTIAIICQDVTVVLAFDTRERLIQWQVKIANNLGEDEQFLVQIQSAPARGKIPPGPARLHIQEHRFCMTVGVPPRLVGYWLIRQLRRYGVVENRFCFEGGSRCGRGEGLYVLVSDQGEDISRAFQLAAEGKLSSRRRPLARNSSVVDSPRRTLHSRAETRMSDVSCLESLLLQSEQAGGDMCCGCSHNNDESIIWPSSETRADSCDFGDASSVADYADNHIQDSCRTADNSMGRCTSCISKLGALSRSSTVTNTPGSGFTPAWTMDTDSLGTCNHESNGVCCNSIQPGCDSMARLSNSDCWSSSGSSSSTVAERCACCPPVRPPKPLQLATQSATNSPIKKKPKPPMPLPVCNCPHHQPPNPYDNYDIPKTLPAAQPKREETNRPDVNSRMTACPTADDYYDTPKNMKESLVGEYGNYDTPPPPALAVRKVQGTPCLHHNFSTLRHEKEDGVRPLVCPCHRVTCWAENWSPKTQQFREISSPVLQRVKLNTDGRTSPGIPKAMPIYATVDKSKKTKMKMAQDTDDNEQAEKENLKNNIEDREKFDASCNYANIEVVDPKDLTQSFIQESNSNTDSLNYANLEFAQSLEHYENSKELLLKAGITQEEMEKMLKADSEFSSQSADKASVKFCTKCGHACNRGGGPQGSNIKQDDYLMMEPTSKQNSTQDLANKSLGGKQFPGYLPMHPVSNSSCLNKPDLLKARLQREMGDKSSSTPSLTACISEACRKRLESDIQRVPGSAMLGINHSVSAANSPYLRRRVMGCLNDSRSSNASLCNSLPRKRSSSADSTKYFDDLDSITERTVSTSSGTQIQNSLSSKNTSVDSINSHSMQVNMKTDNQEDVNPAHKQTCFDLERNNTCHISSSESKSVNGNNCYENSSKQEVKEPNESGLSVNVRRSSSVPCKSGHNRDSSSSNDSGVSIGSLKHRGSDFAEFELPLTTAMSSRRHYHAIQKTSAIHYPDCYHSSLPRRSKSVDPLRELTFQFQQVEIPLKSSSAEAEIPICLVKRDSKGCTSPGSAMPYIDSHSTSSGTSDMSDYIETLSLSSYSSSDTPDCLQLGRPAATTLRPRSGREYHKIDRYILESDEQNSPYTSITSVAEKSESPSPGYVSSSPGQ
ncbi:Protein Dok-7 [Homalodisca vitripennis]|nr:Protein Dok-7 [Homalodisca vitripennis]